MKHQGWVVFTEKTKKFKGQPGCETFIEKIPPNKEQSVLPDDLFPNLPYVKLILQT